MKRRLTPGLCLALALLLCAGWVAASERILRYDVDIAIAADSSVTVTETIVVNAEGDRIRRGIYRDFPTDYYDRLGNNYTVRFDILSVRRDGEPEPFHTSRISDGVRLYIGDRNTTVSRGEHRYAIRYRTDRQLGYFDEHDELYWNAIGPDWAFPIDAAAVRVHLPGSFSPQQLRVDFYTGPHGARGKAARAAVGEADIWFETTEVLPARHGLTIAVGWPKGYVAEPTLATRLGYVIRDNDALLVALLGLAVLLGYYLWAWQKVGRDPPAGVIFPRYESPGLSAAACRYVSRMGYDNQAMTAAIISLAVKGWIRIEQEGDEYSLHRLHGASAEGPAKPLSKGETRLVARLFRNGSPLKLEQAQHSLMASAQSALREALKSEYRGKLFKTNVIYLVPAVLLGAVFTLLVFLLQPPIYVLMGFCGLEALMLVLFIYLLRAPTPPGRKIMDAIDGLKMYLATAEADRLDRMQSPQLTPEVFEEFLPYAYALGVANEWSEAFRQSVDEALQTEQAYRPAWYRGGDAGNVRFLHNMGSGLGSSLSSAVASASSPPGSSSGGGGGGFSGGGGGGGGGGGW